MIDLHTHTTASDGALSPEALVHTAMAVGVRVIAITDHDTVAGVIPAREAARGTGLLVLAGVELSAAHRGEHLHLLCYGIDPGHHGLLRDLHALVTRREARARAIVEKLSALGVTIAWEAVVRRSTRTVGRPHIAAALVEAGFATDISDAFRRYLGEDAPAYLPSSSLSVAEAVALARRAGGRVALAHALRPGRELDLRRLLPDLQGAGVDGLEIYHGEHDARAVETLRALAAQHGLWWSGGSDFHGPSKPACRLGGVAVPSDVLGQGPFAGLAPHTALGEDIGDRAEEAGDNTLTV